MNLEDIKKATKILDDAHVREYDRYIWKDGRLWFIGINGEVSEINEEAETE